ncbi:GNAT family N-acetyltransferase [bacterium]|nr:GNAT family N-acetyltransferase [bacterium]
MSNQINLRSLHSTPELKEKVFELIAKTFPEGHACSRAIKIQDEFHMLLQDINAPRVLFLEKAGEIISTCAWAPFTFDLGKSKLKCAAMGLICTADAHRKQGFSSYLLNEAEKLAIDENAALSVLWSANVDHYSKLGYMPSGFENQWSLKKSEAIKLKLATTSTHSTVKDLNEIDSLYKSMHLGPIRDIEIYNSFLKLPDTQLIKTQKAYAFMGKGRDLHNCIHELGGDPHEFKTLLARLLVNIDEENFYIQLPLKSKFTPEVEALFGPPQRGSYALAKVLNGASLTEKLLRSSEVEKGIETDITESSFAISKDKQTIFASNNFSHFLQLFLGPLFIEEFEDLSAEQKQVLGSIKIPALYFWGFDSV